MAPKHSDYVLGHNDREQLRLIRQARILAPFTDSFLRAAGIVSGMRVLDIGCGMGDVTMLAAQLVGPTGSVVSIDQDSASIETARRRVSAIGMENIKFHQADLLTFGDDELFDAIISRLVLEFVPDTTAALKRLRILLRPGGIMAFQEPSWRISRQAMNAAAACSRSSALLNLRRRGFGGSATRGIVPLTSSTPCRRMRLRLAIRDQFARTITPSPQHQQSRREKAEKPAASP